MSIDWLILPRANTQYADQMPELDNHEILQSSLRNHRHHAIRPTILDIDEGIKGQRQTIAIGHGDGAAKGLERRPYSKLISIVDPQDSLVFM